jgi:hypothetical protein
LRLLLLIGGMLVALMGAVWALQGAYLLPATFMRGPEWIGIGGALAAAGAIMIGLGLRGPAAQAPPPKPSP